jgi:hypothetical protein
MPTASSSSSTTINGKPQTVNERPETSNIEGVMAVKYMYAGQLSEAVQATGHGPLLFYLALRCPAPLLSITLSFPGSNLPPQNVEVPPQTPGVTGPVLTLVPLSIPARPPNFSGNAAQDLVTLTYRYPSSFVPPVLRVQTLSRVTSIASPDKSSSKRFLDVILKTFLVPGALPAGSSASQISFLLQLTSNTPKSSAASSTPATSSADSRYGEPLCKPRAQWVAPRAQLLWALVEGDGGGIGNADSKSEDIPRASTYFEVGKATEFKARIPLVAKPSADEEESYLTSSNIPVQVRFVIAQGSVAAALPEAPSQPGGLNVEQPEIADTISGHRIKIALLPVLAKTSSQVRGMWR